MTILNRTAPAKCFAVAAACLAVNWSAAARAQSMADIVPAGVAAYVGWRGTLDPGDAYAGSHLAAVLKDSRVDEFVDTTLPLMATAIARREPAYAELASASVDVLRQAIRHPTAAFMTTDKSSTHFAIIMRAGKDAPALLKSLNLLVAQIPPMARAAVISQAINQDQIVGISFNADPGNIVLAAEAAQSLAASPDFTSDVAQLSKSSKDASTFEMFADLSTLHQLLDATVRSQATPEHFQSYLKAMDASGLGGVKSLMVTAAFNGRDWQGDSFIAAPAPRTGLLTLIDGKPFDAGLFKHVPADAYSMSAVHADIAKAVTQARDVVAAADPEAADLFDKGLGAATMAVGKNVMADILEPLGDQWLTYNAPEIGGSSVLGSVVINKLDDGAKAKQGIGALSIFLSNSAHTFLRKLGFMIDVKTTPSQGTTVFYIGAPAIAPAWAIKDGYLYAGLFPQTVIDAMRFDGKSIAENEAFSHSLAGAGEKPLITLSYVDTRSTLPDGYSTAMLLGRAAVGLGDMYLAPTAEPFMPPLSAVMGEAAPASSIMWADEAGIHARTSEPFPGAAALAKLSISNMYATQAPMLVSILLPSLNRGREAANRVKSASNLRQIGLAAKMYANDNRDQKYPADATGLMKEDISIDVFVSPRRDETVPPEVRSSTPDQQAAWANEHSSYVWLGKGKDDNAPADTILAYEKPAGLEDGINILFADGHVDFVTMDAAMQQLQAAGIANP